jgi:tyrosinase
MLANPRIRKDVWKLRTWDPAILWYAKAINEMRSRKIANPLSWRYQAAVHDYRLGADPLTQAGDVLPPQGEQKQFWRKCQHSSWFFLPWHRMYLFCFEQIVSATIIQLGGPADWALPYWNYSDASNPNARRLPTAFHGKTMPDGSQNPLLVADRDEGNGGAPIGDANDVDIVKCLKESIYTANLTGGDPGFGGPKTVFNHGSGPIGVLEGTPHGSIHSAVGGWMGAFNTAGLDPIFWLHHSNIDRLWSVWRRLSSKNVNPPDSQWLKGVTFDFHDEKGIVSFTVDQVVDSMAAPLQYSYEDESSPLPASVAAPAAAVPRSLAIISPPIPEMVGASQASSTLTGAPALAQLQVQAPVGPALASAQRALPRRAFLNFENVTGSGKARAYSVYLDVPAGSDPANHPELCAGDLPMFGVAEASRADEEHPGSGLQYTLEITEILKTLEVSPQWDPANLQVSFIPKRPAAAAVDAVRGIVSPVPDHEIKVGRVSLYYA